MEDQIDHGCNEAEICICEKNYKHRCGTYAIEKCFPTIIHNPFRDTNIGKPLSITNY